LEIAATFLALAKSASGYRQLFLLSRKLLYNLQTGGTAMSNEPTPNELRERITAVMNDNELRNFCQKLGVDYEDLAGGTKSGKARELIGWMQRRGRLPELVAGLEQFQQQYAPPPNEPPQSSNRRWWLSRLLISAILIGAAVTLSYWFNPFLAFLGANADAIQTLADLIQIILWIAAAVVWFVFYKKENPAASGNPPSAAGIVPPQSLSPNPVSGGKAMSTGNINTVQRKLTMARRSLAELETKAAGFTNLTIPGELVIQLEDKREEVQALEEELRRLGGNP
jgi:hypothetical protein